METRVRDRLRDFFEVKVKREVLRKWEEAREKEESSTLSQIMEFNWKVAEEQEKLEELAKSELKGVQVELQEEAAERAKRDKELVQEANDFLTSL
mmetsp:Transcript_29830/g.22116  ORF Transcript_29830/g.22116 Transcript_29830/m.22116 type:complete len:95 (+) Transcript_29830:252-536(+)